MITVAETEPFQRKIANLLSDEERADLIAYLSEHPSAGVLIQGAGGIRKLRWARRGYFHREMMPLYLLAVFGKNEKANLSAEEKQELAKAVKELVAFWRQRNGQGIH